jgi:hypothetical protein
VIAAPGAVTINRVIIMVHGVMDMDMVIMVEVVVMKAVVMKVMAVDMDMGAMAGNGSRK